MKKRVLSLILVIALVLGCLPTVFAGNTGSSGGSDSNTVSGPLSLTASGTSGQNSGSSFAPSKTEDDSQAGDQALTKYESAGLLPFSKNEAATVYKADDIVTFIVVTEQKPLLASYSVSDIASRTKAVQRYEKKQTAALNEVKSDVESAFGDEEGFEMGFTYTVATTGFSVTTAYANKAAIEEMDGVKSVYIAPTFRLPEDGLEDDLSTFTNNASTMIGADVLNSSGYTGKGMRIAILDTGIRVDHPNFAALPESALEDPMTRESVDAIWDQLNAGQMTAKLNVSYYSTKIPFIFNYDAGDFNVSNTYAGSDHGTHVAGIAAANKIEGSNVVGVAPDAQLVVMQVFQQGGGAGWATIMAALEDCVRLEVDCANLSLGAAAGFTDPASDMLETMDLFLDSDIQILIASGNDTNNAYGNSWGLNMALITDPDTGLTGTPGTYSAALSVASVDNDGYEQLYITVNGQEFGYLDSAATSETMFISNFRNTELEYVVVPGAGEDADYEGLDVTGKVALVSRGATSFTEKQATAQAHGAIACIVYNNTLGIIRMMINDGGDNIPCVSISKSAGAYLIAQAGENGTGKLKVCDADVKLFKIDRTVSDFSSWGVTPDLKLKPEISGVGGSIYSTVDPDVSGSYYGYMSGTSMATPQITGAMAVLIEYLDKTYPDLTGAEQRKVAADLLMSTAVPVMASEELEYSPRAQGAGLANLINATTTPAYLSNPDASEGRPKAEFGDDPARNGVFTFRFTITNLSDTELTYRIDSSVMTESIYAGFFIAGSPYGLEAEVEIAGGNEVSVPANGSVTLDATLKLTDGDMDYLDQFPNGIYVEGFLYAVPTWTSDEGEQPVTLTMPMVGFYGDWSDPAVFDSDDTTYYSLYPAVVYTNYSQIGTNPYLRAGKSGDKYNAFSYSNPLAEVDFGLLRNVKYMKITVTDKATGDVYHELEGYYLTKSYYDYNYGMVIPFYILADDGEVWDGMDADGNKLPDGTMVNYRFDAWLDDGDEVIDDSWSFDVTVDDTAPALLNADELQDALRFGDDGRTYLELEIEENEYVAAVLFVSPDGTIMGKYEVDNTPGEAASYEFDITGFGNEFTIVVADYACNETEVEAYLNLGDHTNDDPSAVPLSKDRLYGCETYDLAYVEGGWFSANKADFSDPRNETFDSSNRYYAAEYVNGYLIAQNANTGNLELVTPSGTYWKTRTMVTQSGSVGDYGFYVFYDMALDYSDTRAKLLDKWGSSNGTDMLFAVGWKYGGDQDNDGHDDGYNALFRIWVSRWNGQVYVDEVGPITGTDGGAEILTLGITTDGGMYGISTDGKLYSLELSTDEYNNVAGAECTYIGTTDFVDVLNYSGVNVIQSMGYDHNTGTMYWYAHSQTRSGYSYIQTNITYTVDLETGECTEVGSYGAGGQTCLFVPNDLESDLFTMGVDPESFSVTPRNPTLVEGQIKQFKVEWTPWNAKGGDVTWSSSDETVATVDENGFVTALKAGQVTISATGKVWDKWHWDSEAGTTVPCWVDKTQSTIVKVVASEDALYSFIVEDFANADNRFTWVTYADKTPGKVTALSKPVVSYEDPMTGETDTTNALWQGGAYYDGYVYTVMVLPMVDETGAIANASVLYRSKVTKGETPAETVIGDPEEVGYTLGIEIGNMGFDYNTGRMYAVDLTNGGLAIVDLDTGSVDSLGQFSGDIGNGAVAPAMCVTADGTIVVSGMFGSLYTVDPDTLATTRIGGIDANTWYYADMAYDYNTGNIYWNPCMSAGGSSLYLVCLPEYEWEDATIIKLGDVSTKYGVEQTVMFTIPDEEPEANQIPVEGIEITNGESVTGLEGGTLQLSAVTTPARPTVQAKTWTSSDESVVKVDRFGKLSLVGVGTATVTVSISNKNPEDGGPYTDSIEVTVLESAGRFTAFLNDDYGATGYYDFWISMNDYDLRHASADTSMISVYSLRSGTYYDGYYYGYNDKGQFLRIDAENPAVYKILGTVNLDTATDQVTAMAFDYTTGTMYGLTLTYSYDYSTWTSVRHPGSLVTIDLDTGKVTPVAELDFDRPVFALACDKDGTLYAAGSASMAASTTQIYTLDKKTAAYTEFATVEGACSYTGSTYYGTMMYNPQLTYDFGTDRLYLNATSKDQNWQSASGMYLIQLGTENPEAVSLGGISLYTRSGSSIKYGEVYLGLMAFVPEETPVLEVNGIILNKDSTRVNVGGTVQLLASVRPSNAADPSVTWESADETIATVDENGLVTGVSVGTTVVTVTSNQTGISVQCPVQVVDATGPHSNAYTVSARKDALITFDPALPAQTAVKIAAFSGGTTIKGLAYGDNCLYYVVDNNFSFYLYRYDLVTKQTTSIGHLGGNFTGLSDIAYDAENNLLYTTGGFYLWQYDLSKASDGYVDYSNYVMDSDYCTLAGVAVADGAVYTIGTDFYASAPKLVKYSDKYLSDRTVVSPDFGVTIAKEATEMDYDASTGLFYLTDAGNNIYAMDKEGNSAYVDILGDGIDLNGLAIDSTLSYTIVYTDGVEEEEAFPDQRFNAPAGEKTPSFIGTPTRKGYTFAGWTPKVSETADAHVTYTATWTVNDYTITLDPYGGTVDPETVTVTYGTPVGELPVPTRPGYTFLGWYTFDTDELVTAETVYTLDSDTKLGAKWSANDYTVTLDPDGGAVDPTTVTVKFNREIGELPVPVKEGYTFIGWMDADGVKVLAETVYTVAGDSTLTAKWSANAYTITLDANGGTVDPADVNVAFGEPVNTLPVPVKQGYTFAGWFDADGNEYTAETVYSVAGDVALTAAWTANTYTITLDANGGTVDPATVTVTFDAAVGKLPVSTREGYKFNGWLADNGKEVTEKTVYTLAADCKLTASWTLIDTEGGQTGDAAPIALMAALVVLSIFGMTALVVIRKKYGYRGNH